MGIENDTPPLSREAIDRIREAFADGDRLKQKLLEVCLWRRYKERCPNGYAEDTTFPLFDDDEEVQVEVRLIDDRLNFFVYVAGDWQGHMVRDL